MSTFLASATLAMWANVARRHVHREPMERTANKRVENARMPKFVTPSSAAVPRTQAIVDLHVSATKLKINI
jgi:hypothetical protein